MKRKIVFLDIDGVLQPCSSQERHKYWHDDIEKSKMPELYKRLEYYFKIDFSIYKQYDVAAVYYDWDKMSVTLLKLLLKITNAQIVLSSDWRKGGFDRMKDFFTIHGLEEFYIDNTKDYDEIDKDFIEKVKSQNKKVNGEDAWMEHRSIEILEWLYRNQDVKNWVAIDDMRLKGIESNFVDCWPSIEVEHAEQSYRILMKKEKTISKLELW